MAGIAPTNAVPPVSSAPASSSTTSGGGTPLEASIGNVPDKLQQLTRQVQVSGVITQLPDDGQVTINTALGALTIVLPQLTQDQQQKLEQQLLALFQSQKLLTVAVQPGDPPTQALLLLPPASNSSTAASGVSPSINNIATNLVPPPPATIPPLVPGAVLPAVVLLPTDNTAAPGTPLLDELVVKAQAVAGQVIAQEPEQITVNTPAPLVGAAQAVPLSAQPAVPLSGTAQPVQSGNTVSLPNLLQPGTELTLNVNVISPPSSPPPTPTPTLPNQIVATVIGNGPDGQLLLKAGDATLYVKQPADVPVGSTLLLTVEPSRAAAPALLSLPDIGNFGSLQQALATMAQSDPALARQIMESIIPQPNPALAGALFLLFAAFQQSDLRGWMGPSAVDILAKTGKTELIAKLSQALSEGGQTVQDPVVGTWRSYPLPLYNNGQFEILNFYVHGDRQGRGRDAQQDAAAKPGAKSMRFLIDMRLSKLGAMQLDGFVRPQQLDMVIRSENLLPAGLDRELRQSYTNTLTAIGYAGTLAFQTGRQHWLLIRNPAVAGSVVT